MKTTCAMARTYLYFFVFSLLLSCDADRSEYELPLDQITTSFQRDVLNAFYPRCLDTIAGGYLTNFSDTWQIEADQNKMLVSQARHLWTTSQMIGYAAREQANWRSYADHGYHFLRDHMWDSVYGGFHQFTNRSGQPLHTDQSKSAYGNAFALFALAAYASQTQNQEAMELAKQAFVWLDSAFHDPIYGGYFDQEKKYNPQKKDYNSSIHLLEAFTSLYEIWPNDTLRSRLAEMLVLVRDTLTSPEGYLRLYFSPSWQPIRLSEIEWEKDPHADYVSGGHDIETAYLLLEASAALRGKDDEQTTEKVAKKMIDHALTHCWDNHKGGLVEMVRYQPNGETQIKDFSKNWWAQAEALQVCDLFAQKYPNQPLYARRALETWLYIQEYMLDPVNGGWYNWGLDTRPQAKTERKSHAWKCTYHTARAMMRILKNRPKD